MVLVVRLVNKECWAFPVIRSRGFSLTACRDGSQTSFLACSLAAVNHRMCYIWNKASTESTSDGSSAHWVFQRVICDLRSLKWNLVMAIRSLKKAACWVANATLRRMLVAPMTSWLPVDIWILHEHQTVGCINCSWDNENRSAGTEQFLPTRWNLRLSLQENLTLPNQITTWRQPFPFSHYPSRCIYHLKRSSTPQGWCSIIGESWAP